MTCENCLMFTHCRYDLTGSGEPCKNFIDKSLINYQNNIEISAIDQKQYPSPSLKEFSTTTSCLTQNNKTSTLITDRNKEILNRIEIIEEKLKEIKQKF